METKAVMKIDANEGRCVLDSAQLARVLSPEVARRYPRASRLEARLASHFSVDPSQVLATAGADDAIDRAFRALAGPRGSILSTVPGFVEFLDAATRTQAEFIPVRRGKQFPLEEFCAAVRREKPSIAIVASPDNPWGTALSGEEFSAIARACADSGTTFILDITYGDFADSQDLLAPALKAPGVLATGSFSKSRGLAGFRAGWAMAGSPSLGLLEKLREAGPPYSLSSPAIEAVIIALDEAQEKYGEFVREIRWEREELVRLLLRRGYETWPQQGNFVTLKAPDADRFAQAMKERGAAVRHWPGSALAEGLVRVTCPGEREEFLLLTEILGSMEALA